MNILIGAFFGLCFCFWAMIMVALIITTPWLFLTCLGLTAWWYFTKHPIHFPHIER